MELLLAALLGALFGWAANHFLPGFWRWLARKPLIEVFVETDPAIIWAGAPPWVGASYVVPDARGLDSPPSGFCPDWHSWLRERGAVSAGRTEVEVTLGASTDLTVAVDGVRAKVVRRGEVPAWIHLICAVGGADITPRHVRIDLETFDVPTTTFVAESGEPAPKWPRLSLSKGEVEKLHIAAEARTSDIEWTAEILTVVNGKRRLFTIDDDGKPFRTCGTEGLPTFGWYGVSGWQPPLPP